MIKPIFESTPEIALDLTYRLYCHCSYCGADYICKYTDGISSTDAEKLENIKSIECDVCGKELGITSDEKDE